jgi:hypothetical protein
MRAMKQRPGARLISVQQASEEIGLPIGAIEKLIAEGELPVVELPHIRRRFIDRRDLDTAIDSWKAVAK